MLKVHFARELKQYLDNNQIDIFNIDDIFLAFSETNKKVIETALQSLTDLEYTRIEKGKYCRNTFKNEYVIGNFLTDDAVIAYWSALNIHGLTEQFPNKVYVQSVKNKPNKEIFGVMYQFVRVRPNKMIGFLNFGIGSNQFRISTVEKTFIDCFDLVQYSGGFMELIRAFNRTKLNSIKMIEYAKAVGNKASIKRMGFLAELFEKKGMKGFIDFAKKQKSKNYDLFDIYGYNEGKFNAEWRLRLNINDDDLLDIANSIY